MAAETVAAETLAAATPAAAARTARTWLWGSAALTAGSLVVVVVLAPGPGATPVRALSWLLFTGSSVHVASTGWLFTVPAVRVYARAHLIRCVWAPAVLLIAAALAAAMLAPRTFSWLLLPYFCWQFFHYQKQNVGMAALAAASARTGSLSRSERWPLLLAGTSTIGVLVSRPGLLHLRLSLAAGWLFPVAAAGFAVAVAAGLVALARRPQDRRPAGFCVTYLISLLFCLPAFVFRSPYAAIGGMTVAHGLQYLLLVSLVAGPGQRPAPAGTATRLALLANIALIGGAALSSSSHLHNAAPAGRLLFGAYLGVTMAHFVIDAGLWRMRDPLARRFIAGHLPCLVPAPPAAATDRSSADIGCTP